jgi:hypothetical protein
MPSILGFEGLNPLTVYHSYNTSNVLKFVVLEVCDRSILDQKDILAHFITRLGRGTYTCSRWVTARTIIKHKGKILF